jgi:hypothetical protein
VDWHQRLGPRSEGALDRVDGDVVGLRVGLDRHWDRSGLGNREPGCDERVRRNDHLVARPDLVSQQDQSQRVEPAGDADRVARIAVVRELLLERADLRPEDVRAGCHDPLRRRIELILEL